MQSEKIHVLIERYNTLYNATLANILGLAVSSPKRRIGAEGVRLNSGESRSEKI